MLPILTPNFAASCLRDIFLSRISNTCSGVTLWFASSHTSINSGIFLDPTIQLWKKLRNVTNVTFFGDKGVGEGGTLPFGNPLLLGINRYVNYVSYVSYVFSAGEWAK